jgi:hypothetical protein
MVSWENAGRRKVRSEKLKVKSVKREADSEKREVKSGQAVF